MSFVQFKKTLNCTLGEESKISFYIANINCYPYYVLGESVRLLVTFGGRDPVFGSLRVLESTLNARFRPYDVI